MKKALAQLRGMRSSMLPDPAKMKTPEDFNRRIDSLIETLEKIRITAEREPVAIEEPKKKKRKGKVQIDLGMDRMEYGGEVREGGE